MSRHPDEIVLEVEASRSGGERLSTICWPNRSRSVADAELSSWLAAEAMRAWEGK